MQWLTIYLVGNVFGGTALSSYGGFWIGLAIILIPGGFQIEEAYGGATIDFYAAFALYVSQSSFHLRNPANIT
jgi:succinate-acetate transporter protein